MLHLLNSCWGMSCLEVVAWQRTTPRVHQQGAAQQEVPGLTSAPDRLCSFLTRPSGTAALHG